MACTEGGERGQRQGVQGGWGEVGSGLTFCIKYLLIIDDRVLSFNAANPIPNNFLQISVYWGRGDTQNLIPIYPSGLKHEGLCTHEVSFHGSP